jgi:hypothetical protein
MPNPRAGGFPACRLSTSHSNILSGNVHLGDNLQSSIPPQQSSDFEGSYLSTPQPFLCRVSNWSWYRLPPSLTGPRSKLSQPRPGSKPSTPYIGFRRIARTLLTAAEHRAILWGTFEAHRLLSPPPRPSTPFRRAQTTGIQTAGKHYEACSPREAQIPLAHKLRPPISINLPIAPSPLNLTPYSEWASGTTASAAPLPAIPPTQAPEPLPPAATAMAPRAPGHAPASSKEHVVSFAKYTTTCDGIR